MLLSPPLTRALHTCVPTSTCTKTAAGRPVTWAYPWAAARATISCGQVKTWICCCADCSANALITPGWSEPRLTKKAQTPAHLSVSIIVVLALVPGGPSTAVPAMPAQRDGEDKGESAGSQAAKQARGGWSGRETRHAGHWVVMHVEALSLFLHAFYHAWGDAWHSGRQERACGQDGVNAETVLMRRLEAGVGEQAAVVSGRALHAAAQGKDLGRGGVAKGRRRGREV